MCEDLSSPAPIYCSSPSPASPCCISFGNLQYDALCLVGCVPVANSRSRTRPFSS